MNNRTFNIGGKQYEVDITPHLRKKGVNNIVESIRKSLNIPRSVDVEVAHQTIRDVLLKKS